MFDWEGESISEIARRFSCRDPRQYRLGMLTAGPWPPNGDTGVMQWFANRSELSHFLPRVEPRRWGLEGYEYVQLRDALQELTVPLQLSGPTEPLREQINQATAPVFGIRWWGTLDALKQDESDWARELFRSLRPPVPAPPLPARQVNALIERLAQRYPLDGASQDGVD